MFCSLKDIVRTAHTMKSIKAANSIMRNNDERVVEQMKKMFQHFDTYNFLNMNNNTIQFGCNTQTLKEGIKSEWLFSNTVLCDQPSFLNSSLSEEENFKFAFQGARSLVNALPFSLVEINYNNMNPKISQLNPDRTNVFDLVKKLFRVFNGVTMKNYTFCSPQTAFEFFHKQQRDRKIWWRKFSAQPGRFHMTELSSKDMEKSQFVKIQAEFPWGFETVETISYLPEIPSTDPGFFEVKMQRKKSIPHLVTCEASLDQMTLTYLFDSYEGFTEENDSEVLRFCRKLAPYKVAFVGNGNSSETIQNLKGLAQLLAMKIRKCGISVLCLPELCAPSVERQIARNDALGVPFTVILNENTLRDGIIAIRNRDTTLKEQSHVSLIVSHTEKLMKDY